MRKPPQPPDPHDAEAREVERLLSQLEYGGKDVAALPARPRPASVLGQSGATPPSAISVWGRVAGGAALAAAMTQWPYSHTCGVALAGYLAAVAAVFVAGTWAAHAAWRARRGLAHVIALGIIFAAAALAAAQVMPRMAYSQVEVTWRCPR
jgi:hypothetical protein